MNALHRLCGNGRTIASHLDLAGFVDKNRIKIQTDDHQSRSFDRGIASLSAPFAGSFYFQKVAQVSGDFAFSGCRQNRRKLHRIGLMIDVWHVGASEALVEDYYFIVLVVFVRARTSVERYRNEQNFDDGFQHLGTSRPPRPCSILTSLPPHNSKADSVR